MIFWIRKIVEFVTVVVKLVKEEIKISIALHAIKLIEFLIMENAFVKMVYLMSFYLFNNFFFKGFFEDILNSTCRSCHSSCGTC